MIKVKMMKVKACPDSSAKPGQIIKVDKATAEHLIKTRQAMAETSMLSINAEARNKKRKK